MLEFLLLFSFHFDEVVLFYFFSYFGRHRFMEANIHLYIHSHAYFGSSVVYIRFSRIVNVIEEIIFLCCVFSSFGCQ